MLAVLVFCALIVATASNSPTTGTPDKEQQYFSLVPSLLRLERTVALLSAKQDSNTKLLSKTTADISSLRKELRDKDALLRGFTRSLAQLKTDVAFEASLPTNMDNVHDNVYLKFSRVLYNRGRGYSASSGIFTAPVSGTYMFWAHIMNNDGKNSLKVVLYKDGVELARGYTPWDFIVGVASISTVTSLKKGDQVWLQKTSSSKLRGDHYSSYGGALLRAF